MPEEASLLEHRAATCNRTSQPFEIHGYFKAGWLNFALGEWSFIGIIAGTVSKRWAVPSRSRITARGKPSAR
jgi:hypothetical protein